MLTFAEKLLVFIRLARQQSPIAIPIIIGLGILLWLPGFFVTQFSTSEVRMPIWAVLEKFICSVPVLSRIIALLLLFGEAFLLNFIIHKHQLLSRKSWLPALMVVILGSCTPELLQLTPELVALLMLLPAVFILLQTYRLETAYSHVFNAGVLIALASLVYLPAIAFLIFAFVALIIFRPFIWREWLILFFGFLLPYVYISAWFYWKDGLVEFYQTHIFQPILNRNFFLKLPAINYALTAILGLLLLAAMGRFIAGSGTATLKTKKGVSLMLWFLFTSVITMLLAQNFDVMVFLFAMPPLAFFTANYFLQAQRIWIAELLFALLLLGILIGYKAYI